MVIAWWSLSLHNRLLAYLLNLSSLNYINLLFQLTKIPVILGSEALFADLGHFDVRSIQVSKYIYSCAQFIQINYFHLQFIE